MTLKDLLAGWKKLARPTRRSVIVLAVAVVGGGVVIAGGQYALSELEIQERRLRSQLATVQAETARLREDIAFVTDNTARYEAALARGLFADRNRLGARRAIEALLRQHRLKGDIAIRPEVGRPASDVRMAQHYRVIETPIDLRTAAILDSDLTAFMRDMPTALPGFLVLEKARLERVPLVTPEHLRDIRNGLPVELVEGDFTYGWRSVEPMGGAGQETPR